MPGNLGCVIVAVDSSQGSMDALRWALDNLRLRSSTPDSTESPGYFVVLHVQSPPSIATGLNPGAIPFGGPSDFEVPAFTAAIEAHQKRITEVILNYALQICSEKKANVKTEVVIGDPKEKICEVVENLHADLLVMGSRALGPIKRMLLGSVSNYCTNHAQCPVMIVKSKDTSSQPKEEPAMKKRRYWENHSKHPKKRREKKDLVRICRYFLQKDPNSKDNLVSLLVGSSYKSSRSWS